MQTHVGEHNNPHGWISFQYIAFDKGLHYFIFMENKTIEKLMSLWIIQIIWILWLMMVISMNSIDTLKVYCCYE